MDGEAPDAIPVFQNEAIAASTLPAFEDVVLTPLPAAFHRYRVISSGGSSLLVIGVAIGLSFVPRLDDVPWTGVLMALFGYAVLSLVHASLDARRRGWALRSHDLIHRSGILWRRTAVVPLVRIQHVETASGPIERRFGLERLKCFTAGGSGADLEIEGLAETDAARIRAFLLARIEARTDARLEPRLGAGTEVSEVESEPVHLPSEVLA
jgi:membrane protein YdbS with pleckstrin-like domain